MEDNHGEKSHLLSDEDVRRFIADGFLIIDSTLEPAFHNRVAEEIGYALEYELPHPGDNIVPRVPALNLLCECPSVRGALTSLLGEDYLLLPHRFPHNSEPLGMASDATPTKTGERKDEKVAQKSIEAFASNPKMATGSISASAWHQDSHASCGRTRWHTPRAINIFYFPHDVPLEMGPTRFLAGSHLYATLHDLRSDQAFMQEMPAGAVVLAHFDLVHAGSPNYSDQMRYVMKFVALRTKNPSKPTWNNKEPYWTKPRDLYTDHELTEAWLSLWRWLRGENRACEPDVTTSPLENEVLIAGMKSASQQTRLSSLYKLASKGASAVKILVDDLISTSGKHRDDGLSRKLSTKDQAGHLGRYFLDAQFTPEDSAIALGAIGPAACSFLAELLDHPDPWIRMNAVYALGEAGSEGASDYLSQIANLLDDPEPSVIRVTLDAFCALGNFNVQAIEQMESFLTGSVRGWGTNKDREPRLAALEEYRYLSAIALSSWLGNFANDQKHLVTKVESALMKSLDDENGYPALIACAALERSESVPCLQATVKYLRGRSWDSAQNIRQIGQWTLEHGRATIERISQLDHQKGQVI